MRIRIVDAFTDRPFAGNPAGVVLFDAAFPDDRWLQQVAAEVNLSETAFAHPLHDDPTADWALRWFTPAVEANMCGHATLATAHVLFDTKAVRDTVRFTARCGPLTVRHTDDGAMTMDFPTASLTQVAIGESLPAVLGARPRSAHDTGPEVGDLLVEFADEKTVRSLAPDFPGVASLGYRGVIATAAADEPDGAYQFVSRFFGPAVGINEDPVTGSAHTALAPFWTSRLGRSELVGFQASARGGLVGTALRGDRVLLTGHAVTIIDGELLSSP